jgi:hypothetical protein
MTVRCALVVTREQQELYLEMWPVSYCVPGYLGYFRSLVSDCCERDNFCWFVKTAHDNFLVLLEVGRSFVVIPFDSHSLGVLLMSLFHHDSFVLCNVLPCQFLLESVWVHSLGPIYVFSSIYPVGVLDDRMDRFHVGAGESAEECHRQAMSQLHELEFVAQKVFFVAVGAFSFVRLFLYDLYEG